MPDGRFAGFEGYLRDGEPAQEDGDDAEDGEADGPDGEELGDAMKGWEELESCCGDDGG